MGTEKTLSTVLDLMKQHPKLSAGLITILAYMANKAGDKLPEWSEAVKTPTASWITGPDGRPQMLIGRKSNLASNVLGGLGGVVQDIKKGISTVAPHVLDTAGRLVQAGGVTGGAFLNMLGRVPGHMNIGQTKTKREVFGGSPMDAVSGIFSDTGEAGGIGMSAFGNAIGGKLSDIGNSMRLMNIEDSAHKRMLQNIQDVQALHPDPSVSGIIQREQSQQGRRY